MSEPVLRVLLIEDNPGDVRLIEEMLKGRDPFQLECASGLKEGLRCIESGGIDVVLLDLNVPGSIGMETFRQILSRAPATPLVILTGLEDQELGLEAIRAGAADYVVKARINADVLKRVLRYSVERKRAERALGESEERRRAFMASAPDIFLLFDENLTLLEMNEAAAAGYRMFGIKGGLLGHHATEILSGVDDRGRLEIYKRVIATGEPVFIEEEVGGVFKGRVASIRAFKVGKGLGVIARDVTDMRTAEREHARLQEQLAHSQRLEAMGRLASGAAHDFNNILAIIKGNSENLLAQPKLGEKERRIAEQIDRATDRGAALTRQLMAFGRQQAASPRVINLSDTIAGLELMFRRLIGEQIELVVNLPADVGNVKVDPGQIEQVIFNLAINARDAMPEGGRLTIETANVERDEIVREPWARGGPHVMLWVADTGCGMDEMTRARLFEPFFTTKKEGKGTGLGLATVYGIVRQAGGTIDVQSEVNGGSEFTIMFPRVEEEITPVLEGEECILRHGGETLLVAEDEPNLRELLVDILKENGYRVLAAGDGVEALKLCKSCRKALDMLIADVVMPRMSGIELTRRLRQTRPDARVLFISGYADDESRRLEMDAAGGAFLAKPFTTRRFLTKVRQVLDTR